MFQRVIACYACPDVSKFKHRGVKVFLLDLWPECKNLVIKRQTILKIWTVGRLNFHNVQNFLEVECTGVSKNVDLHSWLLRKKFMPQCLKRPFQISKNIKFKYQNKWFKKVIFSQVIKYLTCKNLICNHKINENKV